MRYRYSKLEAAIFIFLAILFWILAVSSLHIVGLNTIYPSDSWTRRREILQILLILYGAGFALAVAGSFFLKRHFGTTLFVYSLKLLRSIRKEARETFAWLFYGEDVRRHALWLTLIVAVGIAVRCFFLTQPMRYDEAYTFVNHVNNGFFGLFYYPVPNNHVFHTLLVRLSVELFGSHPVAIRLPAVITALLNIPLIFAVTKKLNNKPETGFLAASLIAVYPYLLLYDTMARGYSMLIFLSLVLVALGLRSIKKPSIRLSVMMGITIALGLFTIPSFLFPATGILLWVTAALLSRGYKFSMTIKKVWIPCAISAVTATLILYTPVVIMSYGIDGIIGNSTVQGEPLYQFLNSLPSHFMETAVDFGRSVPFALTIILILLLIAGLYITTREGRRSFFLLLPSVLIAAAVVFLVKHAIPFPRTWIYILPIAFLYIDAGVAAIPRISVNFLKKTVIILAAWVAVLLMSHNTISSYPDTGYFPEAPILVDYLSDEMTEHDKIIAETPASSPMKYYLWYHDIPKERHTPEDSLISREYVVVNTPNQTVEDLTSKNVKQLLHIGDAALYVTIEEEEVNTVQE